MINVEIPKDIRQYEAKLIGPLTPRQTAFFVPGVILGILAYQIAVKISSDIGAFACMLVVTPFILFGWVKIYGMHLEAFLKTAFVNNVIDVAERKYVTSNMYEECFYELFEDDAPKKTPKKMKKHKKVANPEFQSYF